VKLSQYAKQRGISYSTALNWWHQGVIRGYQAPSGTIIVQPLGKQAASEERVAIYARVSSAEHRENLERQAERLTQYCTTRGYRVVKLIKEVGSGVNDSRPRLLSLLRDPLITRVVVEHKDRLTRFGFRYIETLLEIQGRTIEVVNPAQNSKEDLLHDVASLVYSICARQNATTPSQTENGAPRGTASSQGRRSCNSLSNI
jgi:putative resolvase